MIENFERRILFRKALLGGSSFALGSMALSQLLSSESSTSKTLPKAKHVIFLNMVGGPSQVDLFDPKPALAKYEGKPLPDSLVAGQQFAFIARDAGVMSSPYKFTRHAATGQEFSELIPEIASIAEDIAIVNSMQTNEINHGAAELFMQTGFGQYGRPSFGAWASYGLGTENENLPAFVVLNDGTPLSGTGSWSAGFLPPEHQGIAFRGGTEPILYLSNPPSVTRERREQVLGAINHLNRLQYEQSQDPETTARIAQFEMAFRMQASVPELVDLKSEPQHVKDLYEVDVEKPSFARNCLLARRLVEQGVRFVQLHLSNWDHHTGIYESLPTMASKADRASAALIKDLKQRGLLESTLVIWGGEFGRTPVVQDKTAAGEGAKPGRDHHKQAFTMWLAGGGIRGGITHGSTDEFGFGVIEDPVHVHDLHATALHLLGIDHKRLTYRHQGRDFRLTDVHGNVVAELFS